MAIFLRGMWILRKNVLYFVSVAALAIGGAMVVNAPAQARPSSAVDIVFVARAHLATRDDIFSTELGPAGQFGTGLPKFAPGSKLMLRHADGSLVTLVDGSNPSAATNYLIDVQSPDVSFDASKIIFAGATTVDPKSSQYGWRLYEINVNGTGFHKINVADRSFTSVPNNNPNNYDFGNQTTYAWWNDLFPAYLADSRIIFSSSRYPSRSEYDQRHDYNLYVMNGDGSGFHRISTERGSLLHPTPLPDGHILVTRWWNNFNQPSSTGIFNRIDNQPNDYTLPDGTRVYSNTHETFNPPKGALPNGFTIRDAPNAWHLMVLNPDGTNFHRFAFTPYATWSLTNDSGNDTYASAQPAPIISGTQQLVAFTSQTDSSMVHSTMKTGIRIAYPDVSMMYANIPDAIAGLGFERDYSGNTDPPYALHPWGMPDGTILHSSVLTFTSGITGTSTYVDRVTSKSFTIQGSNLQYQLYTMNPDGSAQTLLPVSIGTADAMDAKPIVARTGWSSIPDGFTGTPNDDPKFWNLPNTLPQYSFTQYSQNQIQTATIHNPNIYANPPLDLPYINNSPTPGSIALAQVYVDANQFTGAYCYGNYPNPCATFKPDNQLRAVQWTQVPVSLKGEFTATIPADTPAFIVLRDQSGRAVSGWNRGNISIAQGNAYARNGQTVTCIGCHFGHVSGSINSVAADATLGWTNIAPYATPTASSTYTQSTSFGASRINDRHGWVPVPSGGPNGPYQDQTLGWMSAQNKSVGEWAKLNWQSRFLVNKVHLVAPLPTGGDWGGFGSGPNNTPYHITSSTLRFYLGGVPVGNPINVGQIEPLANGGTWVNLGSPITIDQLTFTVNATAGYWYWSTIAALNEIEVIGMASSPPAANNFIYLPMLIR